MRCLKPLTQGKVLIELQRGGADEKQRGIERKVELEWADERERPPFMQSIRGGSEHWIQPYERKFLLGRNLSLKTTTLEKILSENMIC